MLTCSVVPNGLGLGLTLVRLIRLVRIRSVRPRAEEIVGNDAPCMVQAGSIGKVGAVCRPGLPLVVTGRQTVARIAGHAAVFQNGLLWQSRPRQSLGLGLERPAWFG